MSLSEIKKIAKEFETSITLKNETRIQKSLGKFGWDMLCQLLDAINPTEGKEFQDVGFVPQAE